MTQAKVNGVELEYETWGDSGGQPLLLVGGLGTQILTWHELLVQVSTAGRSRPIPRP